VEPPLVLDSFSLTNSFFAPTRLPPVDLLSPFAVSPPLLVFLLPLLVSFSQLPSPLFLLSALPVVFSLSLKALPLPHLFILQAPTCIFHCQSLTSKQS